MTFDQQEFDIRCEWGEQGVAHLAPISIKVFRFLRYEWNFTEAWTMLI